MNLYCIRDRMLNYFQDPFTGPSDNMVMASVASAINNPEATSAIAQAPHHFEIWRIAEIDDQANIHSQREFICDCSALLRAERGTTGSTRLAAEAATPTRRGQPSGAPSTSGTNQSTPQNAASRQNDPPQNDHKAPGGSDR